MNFNQCLNMHDSLMKYNENLHKHIYKLDYANIPHLSGDTNVGSIMAKEHLKSNAYYFFSVLINMFRKPTSQYWGNNTTLMRLELWLTFLL